MRQNSFANRTPIRGAPWLGLLLALSAACSGGGRGDAPPASMLGPAGVRRLTDAQYENSVRAVLPGATVPDVSTPGMPRTGVFFIDAEQLRVDDSLMLQYESAAETLAAAAASDLGKLVPCDSVKDGARACAKRFVEGFAPRAYRRPVDADEVEDLLALFDIGQQNEGFARGIRLLLEGMLQAPSFLYRTQLGDAADRSSGVVRLTDHELAAELSYLLGDGPPDDALRAAADAGQLSSAEGVRAQATRLLALAPVHANLSGVYLRWMGANKLADVEKDPALFPKFAAMKDSLFKSTAAFVDDVLWSGDHKLHSLLDSGFVYADRVTAAFYGANVSSATPVKITVPAGQRAGILTDPTVLASLADVQRPSTVQRGLFVRKNLLCTQIPAPPPNVVLQRPTDPSLTRRQLSERRQASDVCKGCHILIDQIGLTFEKYDAIGQFRATENGAALDATGSLQETPGGPQAPVDGLVPLSDKLAQSAVVQDCIARRMFEYTYGRQAEGDAVHEVEGIQKQFRQDSDLVNLFSSIATADSFAWRTYR